MRVNSLFLSSADAYLSRKNLNKSKHASHYIYLSDDYAQLFELERALGTKITIELLRDFFREATLENTDRFLAFSEQLSKRYHSFEWWGTHLASRSSVGSPLLKRFIYFAYFKKRISELSGDVIVIADSSALLDLIESFAKGKVAKIVRFSSLRSSVRGALNAMRPIARIFKYLLRCCFLRYGIGTSFQVRKPAGGRQILIRSWFSGATPDKAGEYADRNFGRLPAWLQEKGFAVCVMPMFVEVNSKLRHELRKIRNMNIQFVITEQILSWRELFIGIVRAISQTRFRFSDLIWDGIDVSGLVTEANRQTSFYPDLMSLNLIDFVLQKLKRAGWMFERILYPMENNAPEKTLILAAQRSFPDAKMIGFQHTVWYREQMSMLLTSNEISLHPKPDMIVTSGKRYESILKMCNFRSEIVVGPSLRFANVARQAIIKLPRDRKDQVFDVLAVLTYDFSESVALLSALLNALSELVSVRIKIKNHPLISRSRLGEFISKLNSKDCQFVDGEIGTLLENADVVVLPGGTVVALEAMVRGLPVVRFRSANSFYLDPCWFDYPISIASTLEQLRENLTTVMEFKESDYQRLQKIGRELQLNYFEPVSEESMQAFLT